VAIAWIVAGVVLLGIELHHLAFYAVFAAAGCFAAAIVAVALPDAILLQALAAVGIAVLGILLLRPRVNAALQHHRRTGDRSPGCTGASWARRSSRSTASAPRPAGHVRLAGENCLAVSGDDQPIPAGTTVLVTAVDGTTLIVWPVNGHHIAEEEEP
jgi:membrane protein implicated in regulation of membrane protease activity